MRVTTLSSHPSKTDRFDQRDFKIYKNLEELVFKAVRGEDVQEVLDKVCDFYGNDFHRDRLALHLKILSVNFPLPSSGLCLRDIKTYILSLPANECNLVSEAVMITILKLLLPWSFLQQMRSANAPSVQ